MNKTHLCALASLLLVAPYALASDNPVPKNYCEDPSEWGTHYYVLGLTVADKASSASKIGILDGTEKTGIVTVIDGNISEDCDGDGILYDYDGHKEWGLGGGRLTVAMETASGCSNESPHHVDDTIHVEDRVFGSGIAFTVATDDLSDATDPPSHGCDNVMDQVLNCVGSCNPSWAPGADGAYWVFVWVPGTKGHIWSG